MITRVLALTAATALVGVALTGCVVAGPMGSTSPEIEGVTAVVLDTSGDLTIREGAPSLTIHAPENILDMLTAEVSDGVLELGRRPGVVPFGSVDIRYELTVESLDSIELNGSGDIESTVTGGDLTIAISGSGDVSVSGLDANTVDVALDGSGDVELSGETANLGIAIDGSGEVATEELDALDAVVDIAGSGDASVSVSGTLTVDISGSGTVTHRGGAEVDADISGSGDVESDD